MCAVHCRRCRVRLFFPIPRLDWLGHVTSEWRPRPGPRRTRRRVITVFSPATYSSSRILKRRRLEAQVKSPIFSALVGAFSLYEAYQRSTGSGPLSAFDVWLRFCFAEIYKESAESR